MRTHNKKIFYTIPAILAVMLAGVFGATSTSALSGEEFKPGRIIDDAVFYEGAAMTASEIQNFLSAKVPTCDTWGTQPYAGTTRAEYGASRGYPAPYTCLKDYRQDTGYKAGQSGLCSAIEAKTNRTAAQIINDVARACHINQKVLIVMLQKEQGLVTDDWPWSLQYRGAMGYGCPDTAPCDAEYYGFFNQVYNAALQFQRYKADPSYWNHVPFMTNQVQYQANSASCGSRSVYIENYATAGLYNYTPYTPNQAALNNLYGTGDGCSAYGNRNFWRYYNDWFGSTHARYPFEWKHVSQSAYSDPARTRAFTSTPTVKPGETVYLRLKAKNIGYQNWSKSSMRLGTSRPMDTPSRYATSNWITAARATSLVEDTVMPGQIGTFDFEMKIPNTPNTYRQYFNLLVEGREWLNDPGFHFIVNANMPHSGSEYSKNSLTAGQSITGRDYLLSADGQSVLSVVDNQGLILYSNFKNIWSKSTLNTSGSRLTMQSDGNLVLYDAGGKALWHTATYGNPGAWLVIQSDGNLVVYSASNAPLWSTSTVHYPNHFSYINTNLTRGVVFPHQTINTANGNRRLILQGDGNLVLYDAEGKALWHSRTYGKGGDRLILQGDGNLVLYDAEGKALWHSRTYGKGGDRLILQGDGNLVLYDRTMKALWATYTLD